MLKTSGKLAQSFARGLMREVIIPIIMAVIVIQFVIQAFKIPSGSMEDTLLIGDFLLGLKFTYGSPIPFSDDKFPAISDPKPGDIMIFRYPGDPDYPDYNPERYSHVANLLLLGNYFWDSQSADTASPLVLFVDGPKDFIKRCVAKSGQRVEVRNKHFFVDGKEVPIPPHGKIDMMDVQPTLRDHYGPVRLPSKGETFNLDTLSLEELYRVKSLVVQENKESKVEFDLQLIRDSLADNGYVFTNFQTKYFGYNHREVETMIRFNPDLLEQAKMGMIGPGSSVEGSLPFALFRDLSRTGFIPIRPPEATNGLFKLISTFTRPVAYDFFFGSQFADLQKNVDRLNQTDTLHTWKIQARILKDGKALHQYTFLEDSYMMMGDNRDNSSDGRYWGYLSRTNVKAKAFIIYFSLEDSHGKINLNPLTWLRLPFYIRWNRIGKIIHGV